MLQDGVVELAAQRPGVDQLVRIDAGGRAPGDVAQIVGAGAARREPEALDLGHHVEDRLRTDLAQLQIGPRGYVGITACMSLRDIGDAAQDRKSTRLNSSHVAISYAVFCLKK